MQNSKDFHPVHQCNDGLFNAASGIKIDILNPQPHMIDIQDIANALSKICRFGGQISAFYSVAQHSVLVAALAPDHLKGAALLHDAAEAYLGDVIKPLKVVLGEKYEELEELFHEAICVQFGVDFLNGKKEIKEIDMKVLELEHEALQKGNPAPLIIELQNTGLHLPNRWAWDHSLSKLMFMTCYNDVFNHN